MAFELKYEDGSFNDYDNWAVFSQLLANGYIIKLTPNYYDNKDVYSVMVEIIDQDLDIFWSKNK